MTWRAAATEIRFFALLTLPPLAVGVLLGCVWGRLTYPKESS